MARTQKSKEAETEMMESALTSVTKTAIEDMPLNTIRDYRLYNEAARAANKKLRICRYPAKPCPIELHPKQRIQFGRTDQPSNPLPVHISNDVIHYEETLIPGKIYDLPIYIVDYLSKKGTPIWKWFDLPDGSKETRIASTTPRFALRTIHDHEEAMA